MLSRYRIGSKTFWSLLDKYPKYVEECDDLSVYKMKGYADKRIIKYNPGTKEMVAQAVMVPELGLEEDWRQVFLMLDDSIDGVKEVSCMIPWSSQANKLVNELLRKHYSDSDIDRLLREHSTSKFDKPIHYLLPDVFHDGCVHRFENCVYYDINGAHTDALTEIFPKAREDLERMHRGKVRGFKGKHVINIYVGDLCNRGYRGTYNWIVQRTRKKLESIRSQTGGLLLYANTDGAIMWNPRNRLSTSDRLGDIKSESSDGVIYSYVCKRDGYTTSYIVYQYDNPKDGLTIKGSARDAARRGMDLSKGTVNKYLLTKEGNKDRLIHMRTEKVDVIDEGGYYSI